MVWLSERIVDNIAAMAMSHKGELGVGSEALRNADRTILTNFAKLTEFRSQLASRGEASGSRIRPRPFKAINERVWDTLDS